MHRFSAAVLVALFLFCGFSAHAFAQNITPKGADAIKLKIDQWLVKQAVRYKDMIQPAFSLEGQTTVVPADGYYAAKLPFLVLGLTPERKLEVGQIVLNIVPSERQENIWTVTLAFPKTMAVLNDLGETVSAVSIAGQRFKGILDIKHGAFIKYDADYSNITGKDLGRMIGDFAIEHIGLSQDFEASAENAGVFNGPVHFSAGNIRISIPSVYETEMTIKSIDGTVRYRGLPLFGILESRQKILDGGIKTLTDPGFLQSALDLLRNAPAEMETELTVKDVAVTGEDALGPTRISVKSLYMTSHGNNFDSDNASTSARYKIEGIAFEGMPDSYTPYLPTTSNFTLDISNLPVTSLIELFSAVTKTVSDESVAPATRLGAISTMMKLLPPLLATHGTKLVIGESRTSAPEFALVMQGGIEATTKSPRFMIGEFTLRIKGMDKAVNVLRETLAQSKESRLFLQQLAFGLAMMQSFGKADETGDSRLYHIKFTETGDILLNDMPLSGVLGSRVH